MSIASMGELLDRGKSFETRLERYYAEIRDRSTDNGVRLLTYYLARHRRHQEQALAGQDEAAILRVRTVGLKFDVPFDPAKNFHLLETPPETVTGDQLLAAAIAYDSELVSLYKSILEQPVGDEAASVVAALIRVEERDIVMLKKMLAMHYF